MFHPKGTDSGYAKLKHPTLLYLQVTHSQLERLLPTVRVFFPSPSQLAPKSVPALLRSWPLKTELSFRCFTTGGPQIFFPSILNSHQKCLSSWHFCKTLLSLPRGNTGSEFSWDSFNWVLNSHVGLVFSLLPQESFCREEGRLDSEQSSGQCQAPTSSWLPLTPVTEPWTLLMLSGSQISPCTFTRCMDIRAMEK